MKLLQIFIILISDSSRLNVKFIDLRKKIINW